MSNDWTARSFDISGSPEPTSNDLEMDHATIDTLISLAESRKPLDDTFLNGLDIAVTPWVAWQMGIYTEHIAVNTDHALEAVSLALWAASQSKDHARILANTLTAANTCFRAGSPELAETLYEEILVSPISANSSERFGAYVGMANINLSRESYRDAAYYFDKCLTSVHLIRDEEGRQRMLANAARCYLQCQDLAGSLVFLERVDSNIAIRLEKELRTQPPSLEDRLLIVARLHALGASSTADALFSIWNEIKETART